MGISSKRQRNEIASRSEEGNSAVTSTSADPERSVNMSVLAMRSFPPCTGGTMGIPHDLTNDASAKLISAPVSIKVEYTRALEFSSGRKRTASCVDIAATALRLGPAQ